MESEGLRTADAAWFDAVLPAFVSTVAPEDLDADVVYDLTWFKVSLYLVHISALNLHARIVPVVIVPLALDAAPVRRCTLICMSVCLPVTCVFVRCVCGGGVDGCHQFDTPVVQAALKKANGGVEFPVSPFRQGDIDSRSVFESYIRREWTCPTSS